MQYIDEKFKEIAPYETVRKIQDILNGIGIEVFENWHDSGIENCHSLTLAPKGGSPFSNGKGITKDFARASAYGEFIERLQGGLFFYKFQSINRDPELNIHAFAPDARYMTVEELENEGEWMDYIIDTYDSKLTRKTIAEQCKIYDCADNGKILTLPFYSIFEDKYVYLPISFVDQIFATNGCCVGNTKEEAWVHALSEMMERHASLSVLTEGKSAPKIPQEVLDRFPTVTKIINEIRKNGNFDIEIYDYSIGNGFPIVSTRIINKTTHSYLVNVAADPVLEIAVERTLTEIFQGKNVKNFTSSHSGDILAKLTDFPIQSNVINQLETGNGLFTADFFAEEITCNKKPTEFADNSNKTNKELLSYLLDLYRDLNKPVYVRNFSFLGFPCYRFAVPGFSEAFSVKLSSPFMEYAIADQSSKTLKNITKASKDELNWLLIYNKMISTVFSRYYNFGRLAGIPVSGDENSLFACTSRAYASYKLGNYSDAIKHIEPVLKSNAHSDEIKDYFSCVKLYLKLKSSNVEDEKIRIILKKFYKEEYPEQLYKNLDDGLSPYDGYLIDCNWMDCENCKHNSICSYAACKKLIVTAGKHYKDFENGQSKEFLSI